MTDRNRMLQEALRDLCGWHVGMIDTEGYALSQWSNPADWSGGLPDLDSPANWGHWLAWVSAHETVSLGNTARGQWVCQVGSERSWECECAAEAILHACILQVESLTGLEHIPPSVLAWWKAEQEASNG